MITSKRNVYVAAHVTRQVKNALDAEVLKDKSSRSKFIAEAVEEKLRQLGHDFTISTYHLQEDVPLPLEG